MILLEVSVVGDGCFEWCVLAVIFSFVALDFAWGGFFCVWGGGLPWEGGRDSGSVVGMEGYDDGDDDGLFLKWSGDLMDRLIRGWSVFD